MRYFKKLNKIIKAIYILRFFLTIGNMKQVMHPIKNTFFSLENVVEREI